jgi:hypothetical protein
VKRYHKRLAIASIEVAKVVAQELHGVSFQYLLNLLDSDNLSRQLLLSARRVKSFAEFDNIHYLLLPKPEEFSIEQFNHVTYFIECVDSCENCILVLHREGGILEMRVEA